MTRQTLKRTFGWCALVIAAASIAAGLAIAIDPRWPLLALPFIFLGVLIAYANQGWLQRDYDNETRVRRKQRELR